MSIRILFIDDDAKLQSLLKEYFSRKGHEMITALDGAGGVEALDRVSPDIVILDLMLPDVDGFDLLRTLSRRSGPPIIMLTATEDETDRIIGLEMGADDYLHKPINPRELLARIKVVLRRTGRTVPDTPAEPEQSPPSPGKNFIFKPERNQVLLDGNPVELTTVECDILHTLIKAKGRVVTRDRLMDLARGRDFEAFDRSIDVHISRIRKKIEHTPSRPERIKTIWGKGYTWEGDAL